MQDVTIDSMGPIRLQEPDRRVGLAWSSGEQEDRNVFFVLVTLEVDDFERFKQGFDRDEFGRSRIAKGHEVLRSVEQPNMVFVRTTFDSVIDANAFRDRLRDAWTVGCGRPQTGGQRLLADVLNNLFRTGNR